MPALWCHHDDTAQVFCHSYQGSIDEDETCWQNTAEKEHPRSSDLDYFNQTAWMATEDSMHAVPGTPARTPQSGTPRPSPLCELPKDSPVQFNQTGFCTLADKVALAV